MSYTVLARRYRSRDFDEVVGQGPIAATLKASIERGRVAHAYLFTGTRGVGKTSMARIFAKALNNPNDDPAVAEAIMNGQDTDVLEIDGASNNKVEDARDLIASAVYRPMRGPYKIYIIDEVHMLSTAAFNALLKTMEEPPEYVKFILCTTESRKVPATIQSRCQRFDFRNIRPGEIAEHLRAVVEREGLEAEGALIDQVARLGNGSMRDALSILDRVMASGEKVLTRPLLEELLGLPDRDLTARIVDAIAEGDPGAVLESAETLLGKGVSGDELVDALVERLRDLMVLCACGDGTGLVPLDGEARSAEVERSRRFDAAGLVHMIALCESVRRNLESSAAPRALLDALLVRLAMTEKIADVTAVVTGSEVAGAGKG